MHYLYIEVNILFYLHFLQNCDNIGWVTEMASILLGSVLETWPNLE